MESTPPHIIVPYKSHKSYALAAKTKVKTGLDVRLQFTIPLAKTEAGAKAHPEHVTPGEIRILMHLADGYVPKDGAARLRISERAMHLRLQKLREKLGAVSPEQMMAKAFRLGLVK